MTVYKKSLVLRERRRKHIRKSVYGTAERPRLCIYRSLKNIYAQLVDDTSGRVIVGASTLSPEMAGKLKEAKGKCETAFEVGKLLAERAKGINITKVVFDRSGYLYHGRIKSLAEGSREGGLEF
jgi:large subunit ribosomal protein L18